MYSKLNKIEIEALKEHMDVDYICETFNTYLTEQRLTIIDSFINYSSVVAIVKGTDVNSNNFTNTLKKRVKTIVRLSFADFNNTMITNNFFTNL